MNKLLLKYVLQVFILTQIGMWTMKLILGEVEFASFYAFFMVSVLVSGKWLIREAMKLPKQEQGTSE